MVTVTTESGSILKPYILRATYQWCLDFGFSPCIQAIVCPNTRVPRDYVENGMIISEISGFPTFYTQLIFDTFDKTIKIKSILNDHEGIRILSNCEKLIKYKLES